MNRPDYILFRRNSRNPSLFPPKCYSLQPCSVATAKRLHALIFFCFWLAGAASMPQLEAQQAREAGTATKTQAVLPPTDKESFHIYLLMGQSNMVGRDIRTLDSQVEDPRILALNGDGKWMIAREPMHVGGTGIGPGIPFAQAMLKAHPKITIGLIPCAVGGTSLSRWTKGADLYERAVNRAKLAGQYGVIKGVLWHQGESDTEKEDYASTYETRLTQMLKDLRSDLGLSDLPVVVGQIGSFLNLDRYPYADTVRKAISHIPARLPHTGYVGSTGLPDKGDRLHFSAESEQEIGRRFASAMEILDQDTNATKPAAQ